MSLTGLMPSTKDRLITALKAEVTTLSTLLARGVTERDLDEAQPGTPLWDSRVHLGRDGRTGAVDIRADVTAACDDDTCWADSPTCAVSPVPDVLAVDPGAQTEQEAHRG